MILRKPRYNPEPLFRIYFHYNGDIHAVLKDKSCPIKNYPNLYYFCKRHEFEERMNKIVAVVKKRNVEEMAKGLVIYKRHLIAMCQRIFMQYLWAITAGGRKVTSNDLLIAWKMYKREQSEFLPRGT